MYTIGAVVGQLPFAYLFTRLPMSWIIPFMDVAWGIFTLVQYRANSYAEIAAYRFLVGWFEVNLTLLDDVEIRSVLTCIRRVSFRGCIISSVSMVLPSTITSLVTDNVKAHGIEATRSPGEEAVSMSVSRSAH